MTLPPSLRRELKTVSAMIHLYCREQHQTERGALCPDCSGLLDYARLRLEHCPHAEDKPACSACPVHCYKPRHRRQIQQVMRYAGPRMMKTHPIMAIRHLLTKFKKPRT